MSEQATRGGGYEHALALVRSDLASRTGRPDLVGFESALTRANTEQRRRAWFVVFAIIAMIAVWVATIVAHPIAGTHPHRTARDLFETGLLPLTNMILCGILVWKPHAGAQMFVRACCWSMLVVTSLSRIDTASVIPWSLPLFALGCGASLLVLGNRGLEPERYQGVFVPTAHRVTLTWAMTLAVADMQTLLVVNQASGWQHGLTTACSVGMVLAAFGLYRLRAWGLWLNLAMNVLVATLVLNGSLLRTAPVLGSMLVATALAQIGLMLPLVRSIIRGEAQENPRLLKLGYRASRIIVVLLMLVVAVTAWL